MAGLFWHNNHLPSVEFEAVFSEPDISLKKLMDIEDILQECKSQNKKLVEYLSKPEILDELVDLITNEPSIEVEERWRYKYAYIACELLTSEVQVIVEKLSENEALLAKLYAFINVDHALNPLLASFFSKTLQALFRRSSDQNYYSHRIVCLKVLEFLKGQEGFIDLLLKHLNTSAIMDLILFLIDKIADDDLKLNIINWFNEQQLIQRLIGILTDPAESDKHENVSQLLCEIYDASKFEVEKRKESPIFKTAEESINLLLERLLSKDDKIESSIIGGMKVLLKLMGKKKPKEDNSETFTYVNGTVDDEVRNAIALVIVSHLDKLIQLLENPPYMSPVKTTAGLIENPFGLTRLYILKLLNSLLSTETVEVRKECIELNLFNLLLDLFFKYSWNNFLHTQVEQCLELALNCDCPETNEVMYKHIFKDSNLLDRIYDAWWENEHNLHNRENCVKTSYIGHLTVIANKIVMLCEKDSTLYNYLQKELSEETMDRWQKFVAIELEETNSLQQIPLGDPPSESYMTAAGTTEEYGQEETTPGVEFPENDINYESFEIPNDAENRKNESLFNELMKEREFNPLTDNSPWEQDTEYKPNRMWNGGNSSSSDEDDEENLFSKISTNAPDAWGSMPTKTIDIINIWNAETSFPVEQTGWADFDCAFNESNKKLENAADATNEKREESDKENEFFENTSKLDQPDTIIQTESQEVCVTCSINTEIVNTDPNANDTFEITEKNIMKDKEKSMSEIASDVITNEMKHSSNIDGIVEQMSKLTTNDVEKLE